ATIWFASANDQHRLLADVNEAIRHATQKDASDSASASTADDHQIVLLRRGVIRERLRGRTAQHDGIHADRRLASAALSALEHLACPPALFFLESIDAGSSELGRVSERNVANVCQRELRFQTARQIGGYAHRLERRIRTIHCHQYLLHFWLPNGSSVGVSQVMPKTASSSYALRRATQRSRVQSMRPMA